MNTSRHTHDFLSRQQLEAYLSGKLSPDEKSKVDRLLEDCELSKEALAGFTAVPGALGDIAAIEKAIAAKSGMAVSKPWLNILGGTVLTAVVAAAVYFLIPSDPAKKSGAPAQNQNVLPAPLVTHEPLATLNPAEEHFVNPEAKPEAPAPQKKTAGTDSSRKAQPITVNPQPIEVTDPPLIAVKPVVPAHPEPGYNASIGYILDLKITEFEKYRNKSVNINVPQLRGLSAQYESYDVQVSEQKEDTLRQIPVEHYLREGLKAFRDGRYGRCIEKMDVLRLNDANDLNAAFYTGVCYVKLEMYGKALPYLDLVLNSPNNVFHEEARWYKAQALLGNGDTDSAEALFKEIAAREGFYQEKAKAALKDF